MRESNNCPKCGRGVFGDPTYCTMQHVSDFDMRQSKSRTEREKHEHLHVSCVVCGFTKEIPCIDPVEEEKKQREYDFMRKDPRQTCFPFYNEVINFKTGM